MADAERRRDQSVAPRLLRQAGLCVDQNEREVGGRSAGRHVARVLFVTGRVGDDEFALFGGEEAIGQIDGDLLLALGSQAVEQQREIEVLERVGQLPGILPKRVDLIVEHQPGVEQQTAEQARFAMIDRAAGDEAQQALRFVMIDDGVALKFFALRLRVGQDRH